MMPRKKPDREPWMKFYPSDWRSDPRLRMCSPAARGLWIDMICLMHEADPYGHLLVHGSAPTDAQIAMLTATPADQVGALLEELESAGVFSRNGRGVVYSRRMVRYKKRSEKGRETGKLGGNPSLRKDKEKRASVNGGDNGWGWTQKPEARSQKPDREEDTADAASSSRRAETMLDQIRDAARIEAKSAGSGWWDPSLLGEYDAWRSMGLDDTAILNEIRRITAKRQGQPPPTSPRFFGNAMRELAAAIAPASRTSSPEKDENGYPVAWPDEKRALMLELDRLGGVKPKPPGWSWSPHSPGVRERLAYHFPAAWGGKPEERSDAGR